MTKRKIKKILIFQDGSWPNAKCKVFIPPYTFEWMLI